MPKHEIVITRAGNVVTVSDGERTRKTSFANSGAAKGLVTRMDADPGMARRWLRRFEPVQLELFSIEER